MPHCQPHHTLLHAPISGTANLAAGTGEFSVMSSQSHMPRCRVLPPGEFSVMLSHSHVLHSRVLPLIDEFKSSHSHVSHCRVHPPGEFNVMIPEPRATLQCMVLPLTESYVMSSHIHVSHCRVLPPSEFNVMSSQSHVPHCRTGWKNYIRHTENRFSPYFIILFSQCSLGFGERRLSYRLRYTCCTGDTSMSVKTAILAMLEV